MSDISYPLGQIKLQLKSEYISDPSGPPVLIDIYGNWALSGVADKPKPQAYINMPHHLTDLTENGFCNWIREWKKTKAAIINAENARNKILEIQIVEYVKSFDSLTSILLPKKLAAANNKDFTKWKNRTIQKIMEDNPFEYNRERINSLLNNLKYQDSLSTNMRDALNANINQIKELKSNNDIKDIIKYFKGLRNADAHPCSFNISQLPKGYTLVDMNKIAKQMMRAIIDNNILCITKKSV